MPPVFWENQLLIGAVKIAPVDSHKHADFQGNRSKGHHLLQSTLSEPADTHVMPFIVQSWMTSALDRECQIGAKHLSQLMLLLGTFHSLCSVSRTNAFKKHPN